MSLGCSNTVHTLLIAFKFLRPLQLFGIVRKVSLKILRRPPVFTLKILIVPRFSRHSKSSHYRFSEIFIVSPREAFLKRLLEFARVGSYWALSGIVELVSAHGLDTYHNPTYEKLTGNKNWPQASWRPRCAALQTFCVFKQYPPTFTSTAFLLHSVQRIKMTVLLTQRLLQNLIKLISTYPRSHLQTYCLMPIQNR